MGELEKCMNFIKDRIISSLFTKGKVNMEKFDKGFLDEENRSIMEEFFGEPENKLLVVSVPVTTCTR